MKVSSVIGWPARLLQHRRAQHDVSTNGVKIRELAAADVHDVLASLRVPGPGPTPEDLQRQARQELCIAIAWAGRKPIAIGFVEWRGPRHRELQERWAGVPEIYRLHVLPAYRSLSAGAQLIHFFEQRAAQDGKKRIGLGVHRVNTRALDLYLRLGYVPDPTPFTDEYVAKLPGGETRVEREPAVYLTRETPPKRNGARRPSRP